MEAHITSLYPDRHTTRRISPDNLLRELGEDPSTVTARVNADGSGRTQLVVYEPLRAAPTHETCADPTLELVDLLADQWALAHLIWEVEIFIHNPARSSTDQIEHAERFLELTGAREVSILGLTNQVASDWLEMVLEAAPTISDLCLNARLAKQPTDDSSFALSAIARSLAQFAGLENLTLAWTASDNAIAIDNPPAEFKLSSLMIIQPKLAQPLAVRDLDWLCASSRDSLYSLSLSHIDANLIDYISTKLNQLGSLTIRAPLISDPITTLPKLLALARESPRREIKLGGPRQTGKAWTTFRRGTTALHKKLGREVIKYSF